MKTLSFLLLISFALPLVGQNINYEWVKISLYRPPFHPLKLDSKTFGVSVTDLSNQLSTAEARSLEQSISIPGYNRVSSNQGAIVEVVLSGLTIVNKELRDRPYTVEKDEVKSVYHNFDYFLSCAFPVKLRLTINNGQVIEQNLPVFFQTTYEGGGVRTEYDLQIKWDKDQHYRSRLHYEKLAEKKQEINDFLFDHYGYGSAPHVINVGYVKGKKYDYSDVNSASAIIREVLLLADNKENYIDGPLFRLKAQKAIDILKKTLNESSGDKKARINPKVAGLIHYNLAVIAFASQNFSEAVRCLKLAENTSIITAGATFDLSDKIQEHQRRFETKGNETTQPARQEQGAEALKNAPDKNYIVGLQNDTLEVDVILPSSDAMLFGDSVWLQDRIVIAESEKPAELLPEHLNAFHFHGADYESIWWVEDVTTTPWTIARKFCKRILRGAISVFSCNEVVIDNAGYKTVRSSLYFKQHDQYKPASFLNFNRGVSKLVSANTELSEQVRSGRYKRNDFLTIVREFNRQVEPKTSH